MQLLGFMRDAKIESHVVHRASNWLNQWWHAHGGGCGCGTVGAPTSAPAASTPSCERQTPVAVMGWRPTPRAPWTQARQTGGNAVGVDAPSALVDMALLQLQCACTCVVNSQACPIDVARFELH